MLESISITAFKYNGQLIDVLQLTYDYRKAGRSIHQVASALTTLQAIVIELEEGLEVADTFVEEQLIKLKTTGNKPF